MEAGADTAVQPPVGNAASRQDGSIETVSFFDSAGGAGSHDPTGSETAERRTVDDGQLASDCITYSYILLICQPKQRQIYNE